MKCGCGYPQPQDQKHRIGLDTISCTSKSQLGTTSPPYAAFHRVRRIRQRRRQIAAAAGSTSYACLLDIAARAAAAAASCTPFSSARSCALLLFPVAPSSNCQFTQIEEVLVDRSSNWQGRGEEVCRGAHAQGRVPSLLRGGARRRRRAVCLSAVTRHERRQSRARDFTPTREEME